MGIVGNAFGYFGIGTILPLPGFWCVARVRELNIEAPCASTRARGAFGLFLGVVLGFWGLLLNWVGRGGAFGFSFWGRVGLDWGTGIIIIFSFVLGQIANHFVEISFYRIFVECVRKFVVFMRRLIDNCLILIANGMWIDRKMLSYYGVCC